MPTSQMPSNRVQQKVACRLKQDVAECHGSPYQGFRTEVADTVDDERVNCAAGHTLQYDASVRAEDENTRKTRARMRTSMPVQATASMLKLARASNYICDYVYDYQLK